MSSLFRSLVLAGGATLSIIASDAKAATFDGGSLPIGTITWRNTASFAAPSTTLFTSQAEGRLNSAKMWIAVNSAFFMGGGTSVKMELLGNATDPSLDPTLDDIQGSTAFSLSELKPLPIVGSDSQFNYVELNWDLTNLGLDTKADERWGFRLYPETSDGEISIASRKCNFAAAGCPPPSELQMSVFKGSQTSVGSVGSAAFPTYFSLMLDDGPALVDPPIDPTPSPVPLPAGLPMLLAALGLLGLRKHWA